jgi:hypothetical protein
MQAFAERASHPIEAGGFLVAAAAIGAVSVAAGWALSRPGSATFAGAATAIVALGLIAAMNFGAGAGILVLVILNGLPGVDLESFSTKGSFRVADVAAVALVAALAIRSASQTGPPELAPWLRWSRWWAFTLVSWWAFTVLRSNLLDGIPILKAALFGRDFLYFALLVPLFLAGLRTKREIRGLIGALLAGTVLFAAGHVMLVVFGASSIAGIRPAWFIHETLTNELSGFTRVYALMGDPVAATVPFAAGLVLMASTRRLRLVGFFLLVLTGLSVLFEFTRATYFGLFLGLFFASAFWLSRRVEGQVARRLAIVVACLTLVGGAILANQRQSTNSPTQTALNRSSAPAAVIASRFSSGVGDLSAKAGTVGYRYQVGRRMLHVLGNKWPIGLGFWHPDAKYVGQLPQGSIRNGDVGVLNSLMTMGLLGTILIYLMPLSLLLAILRKQWHREASVDDWFFFGVTAWLVAVFVGSISLVTLFSPSGLVFTAAMLACTIHLLVQREAAAGA